MTGSFTRVLCALLALLLLFLVGCGTTPTPTPDGGDGDNGAGGNTLPTNPDLPADTDIVINEICAGNEGSYKATDRQYYDWIEFYNDSRKAQDLEGWMLSDDPADPAKYVFPKGTVIEPYGYLIVLATGKDLLTDPDELTVPFKLSEDGDTLILTNPHGKTYFTLDFPALNNKEEELTYGRILDGDDEWAELDPTPLASNANSVRVLASSLVTFSHQSGFYDEGFDLGIEVPSGYTVYYTTDCSDPRTSQTAQRLGYRETVTVYDPSSDPDRFSGIQVTDGNMYVPAAPVDKCFTLRVYIKDREGHTSRVITKCYFIGFADKAGYTDIPIVCLTSDPDGLYGEENGLFATPAGGWGHNTNVHRGDEWERETNFLYIDQNGNYLFDQQIGIQIRGTSTRGAHQKNLNLYARSSYDGNSSFILPLFEGVTETKSLVLRNDDIADLTVGQGYLQSLVADRDIATQDNYPVVVFLDGEYYGIYNLYERFDDDYVEAHYGVNDKDVWIVKKGGADSQIDANCAEAEASYRSLMYYICNINGTHDLSRPAAYESLCEMVDMQSLIDLLCVQLFIGNEDFSIAQNIAAWRSAKVDPKGNPYADGKWRFVLYDLDFTLDCYADGVHYDAAYDPFTQSQPWAGKGFLYWAYNWNSSYPFTKNLLKSDRFREDFADTFQDIAYNNFAYYKVEEAVNSLYRRLAPNIMTCVNRFDDGYLSYGEQELLSAFRSSIAKDLHYLRDRASYVIPHMANALGLTGTACELKLTSQGIEEVGITVNTTVYLLVGGAFEGQIYYLDDHAVFLEAPEVDGYVFDRWEISGGTLTSGELTDTAIAITLDRSTVRVTAVYTAKENTNP